MGAAFSSPVLFDEYRLPTRIVINTCTITDVREIRRIKNLFYRTRKQLYPAIFYPIAALGKTETTVALRNTDIYLQIDKAQFFLSNGILRSDTACWYFDDWSFYTHLLRHLADHTARTASLQVHPLSFRVLMWKLYCPPSRNSWKEVDGFGLARYTSISCSSLDFCAQILLDSPIISDSIKHEAFSDHFGFEIDSEMEISDAQCREARKCLSGAPKPTVHYWGALEMVPMQATTPSNPVPLLDRGPQCIVGSMYRYGMQVEKALTPYLNISMATRAYEQYCRDEPYNCALLEIYFCYSGAKWLQFWGKRQHGFNAILV
jgi:hypothetical protein